MRARLMPVLVMVALLAVACGSDDSVFDQGGPTSTTGGTTTTAGLGTTTTTAGTTTEATTTTTTGGDDQALIDEIAEGLLAQGAAGGDLALPIDEESAQCLAGQIVSTFGAERLQELEAAGTGDLGSALEQMTPEEQSALIGIMVNGAEGQDACIDVRAFLVDSFTQSGLSQGSAECVADALLQGTVLQDLLAATLSAEAGGELPPEVATQLMTVMLGCLSPDELGDLGS